MRFWRFILCLTSIAAGASIVRHDWFVLAGFLAIAGFLVVSDWGDLDDRP